MRRSAAAVGFVAAGFGCNSIFGLDPTKLVPDAPPKYGLITQQQLTALPDVVQFPPVDGLAQVQIGALDGALQFIPVTDGQFVVPADLVGNPYRLVYQPEGDPIPHEVQWSFVEPHLCIPFFGKPGQPAAPSNATMQIDAQAIPPVTGFNAPLVFSYGTTWTAGAPTQASPGNPVNYEYSTNATALNGPLATLQSGTDAEMLVDYMAGMAIGSVRITVDLVADTVVPTQGPWRTFPPTQVAYAPDGGDWYNRMFAALRFLTGDKGPVSMVYAGVLPSTKMSAFALAPLQPALDPLKVPMFALAHADRLAGSMQFANPFTGADELPLAIAYEATQKRTDMTPPTIDLYNGVQWVRLATQTNGTTALDTAEVGIPTDTRLNGTALSCPSCMDDTPVPLFGAPTVQLAWTLDAPADQCVATLYQVNGTGLGPIRTYEVVPVDLPVSIQIDSTVFTIGLTKYVFGIVCRAGFPNAKTTGQLDQVSYPFTISTVFPATFTVQ